MYEHGMAPSGESIRLALLDRDGNAVTTVVLPGDGGWTEGLHEQCVGADLLVLHLGSVYAEDGSGDEVRRNHVGTKGVFGVLHALQHSGHTPKLTVISELGEELQDRVPHLVAAVLSVVPSGTAP